MPTNTLSIWRGTAPAPAWPRLEDELAVDVAIVGGGITGVTLAHRLVQEGRSVALLEARTIGEGSTGNSTGNLYQLVSNGLHALARRWGNETARSVAESRGEAIAAIEAQAARIGGVAGFRRCPMHLYATSSQASESVEREYQAAVAAGLPARRQASLPPGPPPARGASLVVEGQAQFHPMGYLQALAARASANGCRIFGQSPACEIDRSGRVVRTARGTIRAREIVLATHSPSGFHFVQNGLLPLREYGLAARIAPGSFPRGIFWARGERMLSLRSVEAGDASFLVFVGESRSTGQHDAAQALHALESLATSQFAGLEFVYRWSAQNFRSPDGLPFIGRDASGLWIATGFATDGLVYGALAASIIADGLLGRENRWAALYRADRSATRKGARGLLQETASVAKSLVQDYLTDRQRAQLESVAPGQGRVVAVDGDKIAVYRDPSGRVFAVSPVCTHLGCMVRWNAMEASWDCPCHGSRFAPDGRVLEGPALEPLRARELPPDSMRTG